MWTYNNSPFKPENLDPKELYGFVYLITNIETGKKYIGKKFFWSMKSKQVKGKKKRYKAESDWKDYFGSNSVLCEEVKTKGENAFTREILHLCKSKSECAYFEAKEQFERDVILKQEYYNDWIMVKVRRAHLNSLQTQKTVV